MMVFPAIPAPQLKLIYSALQGYTRVKATPVRRQENKKTPVWDSRLEMAWPLTGIAEVSYSLRFEHSEVSI